MRSDIVPGARFFQFEVLLLDVQLDIIVHLIADGDGPAFTGKIRPIQRRKIALMARVVRLSL